MPIGGVEGYDALNREWYQLILKKKSAAPTVERPPGDSLQPFFVSSDAVDRFLHQLLFGEHRVPAESADPWGKRVTQRKPA